MQMSPALFERYKLDPVLLDGEVRNVFGLPADRYYTVTLWPDSRAGQVFVDTTRFRVVKMAKISKSD